MTKVEEILDKLERGFMPRGTYAETWKLIDAALAAAEFLGMKKQKELDAIWARIDALVVAEARGFAKGHAEGVAEGAGQCRKEILNHSQFMLERHGFFVPASVLAPTKEEG